jgi:hypothetical protein
VSKEPTVQHPELTADHNDLLDPTIEDVIRFLNTHPKAMPTDMTDLVSEEDNESIRILLISEALRELVAYGQVAQGVKFGAPAFTLTADGKAVADLLLASDAL